MSFHVRLESEASKPVITFQKFDLKSETTSVLGLNTFPVMFFGQTYVF